MTAPMGPSTAAFKLVQKGDRSNRYEDGHRRCRPTVPHRADLAHMPITPGRVACCTSLAFLPPPRVGIVEDDVVLLRVGLVGACFGSVGVVAAAPPG